MADAGNKWYVLKAVSGKEAKVKEYIEAEMKHNDLLAANVSQVLIPVEKHATVRNGKRVVKEKVSLPGYVFVEAKLKGDVAHTLRFLPNVLGFLGGLDEPTPVPQRDINRMLPLSIFIFLWTNDTGAYCSGSLFGKHKLFPRISPAKSWEGSIGGGIFVLIAAGIIGYIANDGEAHRLSILGWEGLGLVVVFFGTWGDLVESLFKRTLGVKDSGNILPGHGGMLDRFDSSLMAIPAAVIYLYTIQLFG